MQAYHLKTLNVGSNLQPWRHKHAHKAARDAVRLLRIPGHFGYKYQVHQLAGLRTVM